MAALASLDVLVHDVLLHKDRQDEVPTPTTPRASTMKVHIPPTDTLHDSTTPQAASTAPASQPTSQAPTSHDDISQDSSLHTGEHQAAQLSTLDDKWNAMEIDPSDHEEEGSDHDTENGEPETSTRKKKGQRFFCTGYAPCNLSFTRSEHLARHIRKHTGERPFQCHCNRRFSRLDNLRQHAQTVHVNEEIPTDSLAATGTRFQRQIRTDRVRATGRPRTNTVSSTGSHGRGHSRNASTSSIGSTTSTFSTATEPRRRPPPLLMANDGSGRPKLGIDLPSTPPAQYRGYSADSPGGLSTPTSIAFSATPGSPGYGSSIGSPNSNASRVSGFFGTRTPSRRLSVPSGPNPFQPSFSNTYPAPYMTQMPPSSSNVSTNSSVYASPVSTTFSNGPAYHVPPSEDWRRRTWHPSTYSASGFSYSRPATSGLTYSQTPDAPQPAFAQHATAAAGQAPRLPGIESFDHVQHRPSTPPRRQPSPMQLDSVPPPTNFALPSGQAQSRSPGPGPRPGHVSWDVSRSFNYSEPDGHVAPRRGSTSWGQQTLHEIHSVASRQEVPNRYSNMGPPAPSTNLQQSQQIAQEALQIQANAAKRNRRHGWYNGPLPATRTSPEDSSSSEGVPTPGTSATDVHPAIMHSNGYIEPHHQMLSTDAHPNTCIPPTTSVPTYPIRTDNLQRASQYADQSNGTNNMTRLEALVAVASSEEKATASAR